MPKWLRLSYESASILATIGLATFDDRSVMKEHTSRGPEWNLIEILIT
jgi:hypothetical protein